MRVENRRTILLVVAALFSSLFVLTGVLITSSGITPVTRAISRYHKVVVPHSEFYLDVGGSASRGTQPNPARTGYIDVLTDEGYSNDVVAWAQAHGVSLALTEIGCGGETTRSMISGDDRCYRGHGSQLETAVNFLQAHRHDSGLVTIDLGFNDVIHCMSTEAVRVGCVRKHVTALGEQLSFILRELVSAKGSRVTLLGVGHYDPFLDSYGGVASARVAAESRWAVRVLDVTLVRTYRRYGVAMAKVGTAFRVGVTHGVWSHGRRVPEDALFVCRMTWMCHSERGGPNYHPNDLGYRVIARSIVKGLVDSSGTWRAMSRRGIGA